MFEGAYYLFLVGKDGNVGKVKIDNFCG